jgi:Ca-activated chloride channel homolog
MSHLSLAIAAYKRQLWCLAASICVIRTAAAQTNRLIQEGNQLYQQQHYKEAAADYQKALSKDPSNTSGLFNLSNSLYQQKQYDSSRKMLSATEKAIKDKNGKSAVDYNIGNSYMAQQKYEDAVKAYKQTLRNNPNDMDAKYNLSYAEQMLKKQQQQQQQQQKQQQQQQKQDKDQKNNKDQNKQDKKDGNDKNDQSQQDKDQQKQGDNKQQQPGGLSKEEADRMLNALQQQEKKLQDKLKKEKGTGAKQEKDW